MIRPGCNQTGAWALVPAKSLGRAKTRLSALLSAEERSALQRAMLSDVLAALFRACRVAGVAVISSDAEIAAIASHHDAIFIPEHSAADDLSMAVAEGTQALRDANAAIVAVIPADVPLISPSDVDLAVLRAEETGATIVVPDRRRQGTNALIFGAGAPPDFVYGPDSYRRHMKAGAGRAAIALPLLSLAIDIDTPADLVELTERSAAARAHETSAMMETIKHRCFTTNLKEVRQ